MEQFIQDLRQNSVQAMYQKQGITYLGVFGSAARGQATPESDIDVLIDFNGTKTLFDLADLKLKLQEILGKKVDLSLRGRLKKKLEPYIYQDLITIYEKN